MENQIVRRRHSIIMLFLACWHSPYLFELLIPSSSIEFISDIATRLCVLLLAIEVSSSINLSRVHMKHAYRMIVLICCVDIFDYLMLSYLIDNTFLYSFALVTRALNMLLLLVTVVYLALSIHYRGGRITRKNKPDHMDRPRWRR